MPETGLAVLIVADDLTGAFDTAGPFAQRGLRTRVVADPLAVAPEKLSEVNVVALNTASRHLCADQAGEKVRRCVARFSSPRFDFVFKKIDSTLRGHVAVETMAAMAASELRGALVAPAFPAQGRTVIDGVVHVDGVPLAKTAFARDALSPPPQRPLAEEFSELMSAECVVLWKRGGQMCLRDDFLIIADALRDDDLDETIRAIGRAASRKLLVGSAGLANALARTFSGTQMHEIPGSSKPVLVVVGSRAQRSREQVEYVRRVPDTVVLEAPNGILPAQCNTKGARQIVLMAVEDQDRGAGEAAEVARCLTRAGLELISKIGIETVVVTGGDTAIGLLEASGSTVVDVHGDLMPGIPFGSFDWQGRTIRLITKAGGFGSPVTLAEIIDRVRGGKLG